MIAFWIAAVAWLHPVHETLSEIEWNDQTGRLEVALRLDALDEQWLRKKYGREQEVSRWAVRYLKKRFRVDSQPVSDDRAGAVPDYRWIGRDEEGSHVWWYFEIAPPDRARPKWIEQRVLFERDENYTNRILVLGQVPRRSLTLTIGQPKAKLDSTRDDSDTTPPADRRSRFDRR